MTTIRFDRKWAMPSSETFDIPPIHAMVRRYLGKSRVSVDPFARNKRWATHTNDLNPNTKAEHHMDAEAFLLILAEQGIHADLIILDPPYSPRQISECYAEAGITASQTDTQSAVLYQRVRNAAALVASPDCTVLSFGWNTVGMGKDRGYEIREILMVCHGGAHNDTICMAEGKEADLFSQGGPSCP